MDSKKVTEKLQALSSDNKAKHLSRFFKMGKGEYAVDDLFLGVTVPEIRSVIKKYKQLPIAEIEKLLNCKIHEYRLCGLLMLVELFKKGDTKRKKEVYDFYLNHTYAINNWDLVDLSCKKIVGNWLLDKPKDVLYQLAKSNNLWEQRIAIVSTFTFIKHNKFDDTLKLTEMFLSHPHDLIHKACGWMLREVGKCDELKLTNFLNKHFINMPRIMLRYAIEKLSAEQKDFYMRKNKHI